MARVAPPAILSLCLLAGAARADDAPPSPPPSPSKVETYRLDNGLDVILRPIEGAKTVAVVTLYRLGESSDPPNRHGLTHLLEHLYCTAAAGETKARTAEEFSAAYPLGWNAQTGEDWMAYATVVPPDRLDAELRDHAARMSDLKITQADLDREKPRVDAELANMYERIPALAAMNLARRSLLGGFPKGGIPEQVEGITLDEIRERCASHLGAWGTTLSVAGAIQTSGTKNLVARAFGAVQGGKARFLGVYGHEIRLIVSSFDRIELTTAIPGASPVACVAYRAAHPAGFAAGAGFSFPAFLVLMSRMWREERARKAADVREILYAPLEDPAVLFLRVGLGPDEDPAEVFARLDLSVAVAAAKPVSEADIAATLQDFALILDTADLPDVALSQNPYGVAFGLARRAQQEIDPARLRAAIAALPRTPLANVWKDFISGLGRHGVVVVPKPPK